MALSIRRAAACLDLRQFTDWIELKFYLVSLNKWVLGLWPLNAAYWMRIKTLDRSVTASSFFKKDCWVIPLILRLLGYKITK
jgi:hypothetical protein